VTDVKELCELALDGPEPPLRPAAEALRIARRETRRRDRVRMVVAGLALLSGIGGVAVVAPTVGPGGPTAPPVTAASRPAPSLRYLEPAPDAAAAEAHGEQIVGLLAAAAAEGSTTTPAPRVLEGTATWQLPWSGEGYVSTTQLAIGDETGTGLLAVILRAGAPAPAGDLCAAEVGVGFPRPAGSRCQVFMVGDLLIRSVTGEAGDGGEVVVATRFLADGYLTVVALQSAWDWEAGPPGGLGESESAGLASPPLSAPEVVGLAADPAMLP